VSINIEDDILNGRDDTLDEVVNVYPVFIPKVNTEQSENSYNIPDNKEKHNARPQPLYISKLGEPSPTFSSKTSHLPPVFQPEYLEHSPVFYYAHDVHGVSEGVQGVGDAFTVNTISDGEHIEDWELTNTISDTDTYSKEDTEHNSDDDDPTNAYFCSPQSCLSHPDQVCCSPHRARKRHLEYKDSPGHDRVTATVTRTSKSVSW